MRIKLLVPAILAAATLAASAAKAQSVEEGEALSRKYCSHCHAIGKEGESRLPQATPFRLFPQKWAGNELSRNVFRRMVMGAHPRIPKSVGDPNEFAKIIAYIRTLAPEPRKQAD